MPTANSPSPSRTRLVRPRPPPAASARSCNQDAATQVTAAALSAKPTSDGGGWRTVVKPSGMSASQPKNPKARRPRKVVPQARPGQPTSVPCGIRAPSAGTARTAPASTAATIHGPARAWPDPQSTNPTPTATRTEAATWLGVPLSDVSNGQPCQRRGKQCRPAQQQRQEAQEHHAPRRMLRHLARDGRADQGRDQPGARKERQKTRPQRIRETTRDRQIGQCHQRAAADALQGPAEQQHFVWARSRPLPRHPPRSAGRARSSCNRRCRGCGHQHLQRRRNAGPGLNG